MGRDKGRPSDPELLSTFRKVALDPSPVASCGFVLVGIEGPDRGRSFVVDGSQRLLVGTSSSCDLRLSDREVSRRHLALEPAGKRLRITDLGSTNGSWIDGVGVVDGYLRGGETLRIGASAFTVERTQPVAPSLPPSMAFGNLMGASTEMRRLYPLFERLARSTIPVVIEGETGTGKEVLAEALHDQGARAEGPFVVFDCTAGPPHLVESELFGHEAGVAAFVAARRGAFEQAEGGTLLIDEIGDLDIALQAKLLRVLERSEVRRVGGEAAIKIDVRVLAATRRDLDREVQRGRFREDLFHRLAVGRVELPPLRRRKGDVAVLAARFCEDLGGSVHALSPEWVLRWEDYAFPGNVRELRNIVSRTLALGELSAFRFDAPSEEIGRAGADPRHDAAATDGSVTPPGATGDLVAEILGMCLPLSEARQRLMEAFERLYIEHVLAEHQGNVTKAAAASRVGRRYFQRLKAKKA